MNKAHVDTETPLLNNGSRIVYPLNCTILACRKMTSSSKVASVSEDIVSRQGVESFHTSLISSSFRCAHQRCSHALRASPTQCGPLWLLRAIVPFHPHSHSHDKVKLLIMSRQSPFQLAHCVRDRQPNPSPLSAHGSPVPSGHNGKVCREQ